MKQEVIKLCNAVKAAGGRAMLVGGSVRDRLMGIESKDYDVEVYGVEPSRLRKLLETIATVNTVGGKFAVYKLVIGDTRDQRSNPRFEIDVSIPRRESKSGPGHRGFEITGDPYMKFSDAARRRDFTINAILYDPLTDETVDPYGGKEDLQNGILRAVAAETFVEDSLRVLRGVQLAARFEMAIEPGTAKLCRGIDLSDLPHERVWGEMEKLLTLAKRPSIGLRVALDLGVLLKLFPPLFSLAGDQAAFGATANALDEAVELASSLPGPKKIAVMLAVLCHRLPLNDVTGVLDRLGIETLEGYKVRDVTLALVREREKPRKFYEEKAPDGSLRRLARRVELDLLHRVAVACRRAIEPDSPAVAEEWFMRRARELGVEHEPPPQILYGRHLLEAGFEPGPALGDVLKKIYELQLDGQVTTLEEALAAARLESGSSRR